MNTKRGFTLIEILTVVVIIGILATIVTVAVAGALRAAQRARISVQMNQIATALEQYKNEFGEYLPDMFDDDALVRHVKKRWPRLDFSRKPPGINDAEYIRRAINAGYGNAVDFAVDFTVTGSQIGALAFWLGGFPNAEGKLSGFSADPENPFFANPPVPPVPIDERVYDNKVFVNWEIGNDKSVRLSPVGDVPSASGPFVPVVGTEIRGVFVPFVYFRGSISGGPDAYVHAANDRRMAKNFNFSDFGFGFCVPYIEEGSERDVKWKNPTTFQLIHPGLDGRFGETEPRTRRVIKSGEGIGFDDLDNITNFSDYKELKSILP